MARERRDAVGPQEKPLQQSRREATRVRIRAEVVGTQRKTKGRTDWTWQDGGDGRKAKEARWLKVPARGNERLSREVGL